MNIQEVKDLAAFKYLILWNLWKVAKKNKILDVYEEIASSFKFELCDGKYVLNWLGNGEKHEKIFLREDFIFFNKGNTKGVRLPDANNNQVMAEKFANEIYKISPGNEKKNFYWYHKYIGLITISINLMLLALFFNNRSYFDLFFIILFSQLEYFSDRAAIKNGILAYGFVILGLNYVAIFAGLVNFIYCLFMLDKRNLPWNLLLNGVLIYFGLYLLPSFAFYYDRMLLPVVLILLMNMFINIQYGNKVKLFVFLVPAFIFGLYFEKQIALAYTLLCIGCLLTISRILLTKFRFLKFKLARIYA